MILAIVGSRTFSNPRGYRIAQVIIAAEIMLPEWTSFVSGGAPGVDTICQEYCEEMDRGCKVIRPVHRRWEPDGYKARNIKIAEKCDALLCIRNPESATYGSGWTADYADTLGKPVTRVEIS